MPHTHIMIALTINTYLITIDYYLIINLLLLNNKYSLFNNAFLKCNTQTKHLSRTTHRPRCFMSGVRTAIVKGLLTYI